VFQDFKLVKGTWDVKNPQGQAERVRPQDITQTGLLTVEGELDDISGSGQTAAAHDLCTGITQEHQMHLEAKGAGHYGIFSGRRWRETVYPVVKAFIRAHQPKPAAVAAPAPVAPEPAAPVALVVETPVATPVTGSASVPDQAPVKTPAKVATRPAVKAKAAVPAPAKAPPQQPVAAAKKTPAKAAAKKAAAPARKKAPVAK
jgi:poly(3-hydroxybutyrate) depolymerase